MSCNMHLTRFKIRTIASLAVLSICLILYFMHKTGTVWKGSKTDHVYEKDTQRLKQTASGHLEQSLQARKELLNRQCDDLNRGKNEYGKLSHRGARHIIVNDKYKVLYCYVPKIACTNLRKIFLILTGNMNTTDPLELVESEVHLELDRYLTYLHTFPPDEIMYRLNTYRKVVFVRDPLTRVLSAYRNKFLPGTNNFYNKVHGKKIIRLFRKNPSNKSLTEGHDVKFSEFVDYLTHSKTNDFDDHWELVYNLCNPCNVRYDFIGKYESLEEDVNHLLHEIAADVVKLGPRLNKSEKTEITLKEFYEEIAPEMIVNLLHTYKLDYSLFGYEVPEELREICHL